MKNKNNTIHLQDMGSFHIGGRKIDINDQKTQEVTLTHGGEPVKFDLNQTFQGEHMYVQYYIPEKIHGEYPLLLWHGGGLTGAVYETTPDGRSGWLKYFIQQGWCVYNSDSVERGRSGWLPYHEPFKNKPLLFPEYFPYEVWRLGKGNYSKGSHQPYKESQFPIEYYDNLVKQLVPSWTSSYEATLNAYNKLIDINDNNIIIAHSQGALYAFKVAEQYPEKIKAIIAIEPGIGGNIELAKKLKHIPILVLYGDFIDKSERWSKIFERTKDYYNAITKAGGDIETVFLRNEGIKGNSHMMMMDKNSNEVANFIQDWMEKKGFTK